MDRDKSTCARRGNSSEHSIPIRRQQQSATMAQESSWELQRPTDVLAMEEGTPNDHSDVPATGVYVFRRDGNWYQTTDEEWHRLPRPWYTKLADSCWKYIESRWPDLHLEERFKAVGEESSCLSRRLNAMSLQNRICLVGLLCLSVLGLSTITLSQVRLGHSASSIPGMGEGPSAVEHSYPSRQEAVGMAQNLADRHHTTASWSCGSTFGNEDGVCAVTLHTGRGDSADLDL